MIQLAVEVIACRFFLGATDFGKTRISLSELSVLPPQWVEHTLELSTVLLNTYFDEPEEEPLVGSSRLFSRIHRK